jgi:hypothetical protein
VKFISADTRLDAPDIPGNISFFKLNIEQMMSFGNDYRKNLGHLG